MRERMKKLVSVLLTTAMAVGMLAGCGSSNTNSTSTDNQGSKTASADGGETTAVDTSEHVDLTMYLIGDRTPDFDEV